MLITEASGARLHGVGCSNSTTSPWCDHCTSWSPSMTMVVHSSLSVSRSIGKQPSGTAYVEWLSSLGGPVYELDPDPDLDVELDGCVRVEIGMAPTGLLLETAALGDAVRLFVSTVGRRRQSHSRGLTPHGPRRGCSPISRRCGPRSNLVRQAASDPGDPPVLGRKPGNSQRRRLV
jgi:hypothetical protein